ncbi:DUF554 domain-containing protein [Brevibacillus fluminis]|uniref:DUF554 domain-containing protein n=1 Tax=Brevibacillus fluminis TaxID=511487 RepID=A0A3M8D688_9BACL|nr:DUF554 domain-containing protein [Brevibacillus fluminis]RNB83428.1 DUF554 domain-containing protein [Brevibacillus fluminis]
MVLLGTLANVAAIIVGALAGKVLSGIPEGIKKTVMHGLGLAVIILGLKMSFESKNYLLMIISLVIGTILGELIQIEDRLNQVGKWLEKKLGGKEGGIANGFVTATLVYCVGAMAVLGSLDSGLRGNHEVLYTKSLLDGFSAVIFASTLGIGVLFSAIPVLLYQGSIALLATQINQFAGEDLISAMLVELTGVGGLLIIAIGINVLGLLKIRVANMLPSLFIAAFGVPVVTWLTKLLGS